MKIAAIVLAAGQSQRFGTANKLFAPYKGLPLIDHCLNAVSLSDFSDRILVTGHEHERVSAHNKNLPIKTVYNREYKNGMGSSLAAGVKSLPADCDAFMVFLADMPDITPYQIADILAAFQQYQKSKSIIRCTYEGQPGHPVLFDMSHARELRRLNSDQGASEIITKYAAAVHNIEVSSAAVVRDIDHPGDI